LEDNKCLIAPYETGMMETTHTRITAGIENKLGGDIDPRGAAV
jgi:hypothetical protein